MLQQKLHLSQGLAAVVKEHWMLSVHTVTREEKSLPSASPPFPPIAHPADITFSKTYVYAKISHSKAVLFLPDIFTRGNQKNHTP